MKSQPGVASPRADVLIKSMMFPEKRSEFLWLREEKVPIQRKEFSWETKVFGTVVVRPRLLGSQIAS